MKRSSILNIGEVIDVQESQGCGGCPYSMPTCETESSIKIPVACASPPRYLMSYSGQYSKITNHMMDKTKTKQIDQDLKLFINDFQSFKNTVNNNQSGLVSSKSRQKNIKRKELFRASDASKHIMLTSFDFDKDKQRM